MVFNNSSSVESLLVQLVDEVSREDLYKTHVNVDENCILYHNVQYLGSTTLLNAPNQSLEQLQSCLLMLHEAASPTLKNTVDEMFTVTISINESTNGGSLRILDESTFGEIMKFEMTNVQRCFRGQTKESCLCVIILVSTPKPESTNDVTIYGFRFSSSNTAVQIIRYFSKIFKSSEPCDEGLRCDSTDQNSHNFRLSFDIKELDNKNVFMSVPRTRNVFRLRKDRCKRMMITIEKRSLSFLRIDRCFGVLLSHGVNVANHKMKLLDTISHEYDLKLNQLQLIAIWDQDLINLTWLDDLHCDSQLMHFTIALDLVFNDVIDPTRVKFEFITKVTRIAASANIVPSSAELASWYYSKKPLTCDFVVLTNRNQNEKSAKQYVVMRSCGAITTKSKEPNTLKCITSDIYNDIDSNEMDGVVLSGEGRTRKEYSRDTLQEWKLALHEWNVPNITPKSILKLIDEDGIPDSLRSEIWYRLSCQPNCCNDLLDTYRKLISMESSSDLAIERDLARTFPAHEYFRKSNGAGQKCLFRICKAYALYDKKVSYCQGISFVAATLLIHLPEEQAFQVLVYIMTNYNARDLFLSDFFRLHCSCYQLLCLMKEDLPALHKHFENIKLEVHMYALQWFLTLFTSKFQIPFVFRVMDLLLAHGFDMLLLIALSILKYCADSLIALDFEECLRYFRVVVPKLFNNEDDVKQLMYLVRSVKINKKQLKLFEKDYIDCKLSSDSNSICQERLLQINHELHNSILRLDAENDLLVNDFFILKMRLEQQIKERNKHIEELSSMLQLANDSFKHEQLINADMASKASEIEKQFSVLIDLSMQQNKVIDLYKELYFSLKQQQNVTNSDDLVKEMEAMNLEMIIQSKQTIAEHSDGGSKSKKWIRQLMKNFDKMSE